MRKWLEYRRNKKAIKYFAVNTLGTIIKENARLVEIISYIGTLSQEDIQKLLVNASVETMGEKE